MLLDMPLLLLRCHAAIDVTVYAIFARLYAYFLPYTPYAAALMLPRRCHVMICRYDIIFAADA